MGGKDLNECHIRHCMLYEFHRGSNATRTTKNICAVYPDAMTVRKCQRWFSKFKKGDYDLSDKPRSGRPTILDNDLLKASVEANPCQSTRDLARRYNASCSTIHEHLKQIGKVSKERIWVPYNELT